MPTAPSLRRKRLERGIIAGLVACALLIAAPPARADATSDARTHFAHGVKLFESGDFTGALQEFQTADKLHHSPAIRYNIGRTDEALGHAQAAVDAYQAYLAEAGDTGRFTAAAAAAIAQISKRCTHLRVTTNPPGARVFADGLQLSAHSPTTVLLLAGHHRIEIDLDGWTDAREYDAAGSGASDSMKFTRPAKPKPAPPAPAPAKPAPAPQPKPAAPAPKAPTGPVLEGLMGEAALSIYGYRFVGTAQEKSGSSTTTANSQPGGVAFGLSIEVGWALSHRTALLLRGFGGLGSSSGDLASLGAAGPAVTFRLNDSWWAGGGVLFGAGRANSDATSKSPSLASASDSQITVRTDLAVGPMLELSYALADNPAGQWLVSIMPSTLFTTLGKQSTIFLPLVIGHRWL